MLKLQIATVLREDLLGGWSADPEIAEKFIISKSGDAEKQAEEMAALPGEELVALNKTVFPRDTDGAPMLWNYQIKGFFKEATGILIDVDDSYIQSLDEKTRKRMGLTKWTHKRTIDNLVFVEPRRIRLQEPDVEIGSCQRTLRCGTMRGERTALANSESVNAGTTIEFTVVLLNKKLEPVIRECLDYGRWKGFGQWRNSGKGCFDWTEVKSA